jgi:hypothetical protein
MMSLDSPTFHLRLIFSPLLGSRTSPLLGITIYPYAWDNSMKSAQQQRKRGNFPHNSVVFVFGKSKTQKVNEVIVGSGEKAIHCGGRGGESCGDNRCCSQKYHHILMQLLLQCVIIWATHFIRRLNGQWSTHRAVMSKCPLDERN